MPTGGLAADLVPKESGDLIGLQEKLRRLRKQLDRLATRHGQFRSSALAKIQEIEARLTALEGG